MARDLRQNTATRISVGPFLDKTDGITPETGLTATNEHLTFIVDTNGVPTLVIDANATASGGDNDMVHITKDDAGMYDLELTAAQTNYVGRAILSINYVTDHAPVFHEFNILPAAVFDAKYGADILPVNVTKIGGTTQTARDIGASVLVGDKTGFALSAAGILAIWHQALTDIVTASTVGKLIKDYLDAAISSRSNGTGVTLAADQAVNVTKWNSHAVNEAINGDPVVTLAATQAAYAPAKAGDKMDIVDSPSATGVGVIVSAIWDKALTGITTAGSIGKLIKDKLAAIPYSWLKP